MQPPQQPSGRMEVSFEEAYVISKALVADLVIENRLLQRRLAQAEMQLRELLPETPDAPRENGKVPKEEVPA